MQDSWEPNSPENSEKCLSNIPRSNTVERDMKIPRQIPTKIVVALLLTSTVGTAAAAFTLFTHTFPPVPVVPPPLVLATTCSTLTGPASVVAGTSGSAIFTCMGGPAFSSIGGTVTPGFCLGCSTLYTDLGIVPHGAIPVVGSCGTLLTNGTPIIVVAGDYDYCALYANAPQTGQLPSFQITWSQ